jgi:aspartate/methionine/tyrosine aminotransferase
MARFPDLSWSAGAIRESVFARLAARLAAHRGRVYPFYLGYLSPPPAARLAARRDLDDPALYRYGAPAGEPALLEALAAKCRRESGLAWVDPACIQVTCGATAALAAAARALLDPGDELIVCSPHWPLIRGIATNAGAVPVEVELSQRLYADPEADVASALSAAATDRTRAIYFATPNNPDGKVLDERALSAIARFAAERGLWVIADEVYDALVFDGAHRSIAALPGMAERTVTAFSLSKTYALPGLRLGYLVAPPPVMRAVRKIANHTVYNPPVALQRAGLAALEQGEAWITEARAALRAARDTASAALAAVPHHRADGATYLLLDLRARIGDTPGAVEAFHDRLLDGGVALSPGEQFGAAYARHARLCFSAVSAPDLAAGLARLVELLG